VSISLILVNAIIFIIIGILREDPLSMGILDVFFENIVSCVSFTNESYIYLKFGYIYSFKLEDVKSRLRFDTMYVILSCLSCNL
jgi:hypothetical protein